MDDLEIIKAFTDALPGRTAECWDSVQVAIRHDEVAGEETLAALFQDAEIKAGWVVRTDAVLILYDGTWVTWRTGEAAQGAPWKRLLSADLALADQRGRRIDHLRGTTWRCQEIAEVTEGGEPMLHAQVKHFTMRGDHSLCYRVYWAARPAFGVETQPEVYQPVASRLLKGSKLRPRIDPP